jgi:hypothetical protein
MKTTTYSFSIYAAVLLAGCATTPQPDPPKAKEVATIHVHSLPPGCFVELNGDFIGATPCAVTVDSSSGNWPGWGYETYELTVWLPKQSTAYWRRMFFGGQKIPKRVVARIQGAESWYHSMSPQQPRVTIN